MIVRIGISIIVAITLLVVVFLFKPEEVKLFDYYEENLRSAFFTGFLTLGIFMLSLKTFIIIKMKESVYDHEKYLRDFQSQKQINENLKLYEPLENLSNLLFISVLSALITSVTQFTLGLIDSKVTVYICLALPAFTLSMIFLSLWEIKMNLNRWFALLEEDHTENNQSE